MAAVESRKRAFDLQERIVSFAAEVCKIVERLPSTRIGNHVSGQLTRCATSPAPNYAEAQAAESRRDFIHKLKLCLKELRETQAWLLFIQRMDLVPNLSLEPIILESNELIAIFVASIKTAQRNATDHNPD